LTNDPDEDYEFGHYTVDGARIDGDTFILDKNVAVSGVFTYAGLRDKVITIDNLGAGGSGATLTVPAGGDTATLAIGTADSIYADPDTIGAFGFSGEAAGALAGVNSITVNFSSSAPADISLAYAHYVRQALQAAKPRRCRYGQRRPRQVHAGV
jgi:hypothetical protein